MAESGLWRLVFLTPAEHVLDLRGLEVALFLGLVDGPVVWVVGDHRCGLHLLDLEGLAGGRRLHVGEALLVDLRLGRRDLLGWRRLCHVHERRLGRLHHGHWRLFDDSSRRERDWANWSVPALGPAHVVVAFTVQLVVLAFEKQLLLLDLELRVLVGADLVLEELVFHLGLDGLHLECSQQGFVLFE